MITLSPKQELALLKLYQNEIVKRLSPLYFQQDDAQYLSELLPLEQITAIAEESDNETQFATKLWSELEKSPMSHALYATILNYLYKVEPQLHSYLSVVYERDRRSHFSTVLEHLDSFMLYSNVPIIIEHLRTIRQYAPTIAKLEESLKGVKEPDEQKRLLLRTVPLFGSGAVFDILRGVWNCGDEAKEFVEKIVPNFLRCYGILQEDRIRPTGLVQMCSVDTPIDDFMAEVEKAEKKHDLRDSPHAVDLKWESLISHQSNNSAASSVVFSLDANMHGESPIHLRNYQKELSEWALLGENTIICAPTGSGKTIVSANIIKQYLVGQMKKGKQGKVLFLIPNTFILDQQADTMRKYLQHMFKVLSICGSDNIALRPAIEANHVVVTTPQMIVNLLQRQPLEDMDRPVEPFRLSTFGMIVFDEVHATKKNAPYNRIMQQYHRDKFSGKLRSGERLPQIVGLTASLGVGEAKNDRSALEYITDICARLDCKRISMVRKYADDLKEHSPITPDECKFCPDRDELRLQFHSKVVRFMEEIEGEIINLLKSSHVPLSDRSSSPSEYEEHAFSRDKDYKAEFATIGKPPLQKGHQKYEGWVANMKNRLIPESTILSQDVKFEITKKLDVLKCLFNSLEMSANFTTIRAYACMGVELDEWERKGTLDEKTAEKWKKYKQLLVPLLSDESAIVREVVDQLCLQHSNLLRDWRAIVFIRTREHARILSEMLRDHPQLRSRGIGCEYITGINSGTEEEKSSKKKQEDKLARFASGAIRCLISTSVAEEGLDIAMCNLVIKYNYASNEIAHVQRRGRGRAEGSRCMLLSTTDTLIKQEDGNKQKETLMNEALDYIHRGMYPLEKKVSDRIEVIWREIQKDDADRDQLEEKMANNNRVYDILCKKCSTFLCTSKDIRSYNNSQYCVCAPDFWKKVRYEKATDSNARKYDCLFKLLCTASFSRKCGCSIGRVVSVLNGQLPVIAADQIQLRWRSGNEVIIRAPKKWKDICKEFFLPPPIRHLDIHTMQTATGAPKCQEVCFNIDAPKTPGTF